MQTRFSTFIQKAAQGKVVLLLLVLYILFAIFALRPAEMRLKAFSSGNHGPIDLKFGYSAREAYDIVGSYGEAGRFYYRIVELVMDSLYPLLYTALFGLAIIYFFRKAFSAGSFIQKLAVVPFIMPLFDYLENICIILMLSNYPARMDTVAQIGNIFTLTKWMFLAASLVLLLTGMVALLVKKVTRKN